MGEVPSTILLNSLLHVTTLSHLHKLRMSIVMNDELESTSNKTVGFKCNVAFLDSRKFVWSSCRDFKHGDLKNQVYIMRPFQ